jgi:uncharacterized protein involved in outer membrane biogenesis
MTTTTLDRRRQAEAGRRARDRASPGGGPHPFRWILGGVALIVLALVVFLALFDWDWLRPPLARMLSARLHRPVRIEGHLKVRLFSWTPSATVEGLQIGDPDWVSQSDGLPRRDMADFGSITVKVKLMPLFIGRVILPLVDLERPNLVLLRDRAGRASWDFSDGKAPAKPIQAPPIQDFVIDNGTLKIVDRIRRLSFSGRLAANETAAGAEATGFRLTGDGELNAKPFAMRISGGPLLNVAPDRPYPFDATVSAGDTQLTAKGVIPHPFNLGETQAALSIRGASLADLYYLTGLALPDSPPYSISGQFSRDNRVYRFDKFVGRVGGSDLEGSLTVDASKGPRPYVRADLRSRVLNVKDLGALFGATGRNKPSAPRFAMAPTAAASAATPATDLLPDAPLDVERVRGMDADVTYKALTVRASPNLPLRQVSLGLKLDRGLLTLAPIDFDFPQGRLSGSAVIDARSSVQTDAIDMRVAGVQLQEFLAKGSGPPPLEGVLDARAKLSGTGDSVHKAAASSNGEVTFVIPRGVIRQAFAELLGIDASKGLFMLLSKNNRQTDVRCAVADFRVHNGVMRADRIVLDTGVVLVNGQGDIDLNSEKIDLSFAGKPKQFRLIRIDAPIVVSGRLRSPSFGIKIGGAAVQAGVATALAAAVNPLLLILPFVETGHAHDADCAGLVTTAKTQGAPVKVSATTPAKTAK